MIGARLVLAAMLIGIGLFNWWAWGSLAPKATNPTVAGLVCSGFSSIFVFAIIVTFWFSLAKADVVKGQLVIDQNCWYLRARRWLFPSTRKEKPAKNICELFWGVAAEIFLVIFMVSGLSVLLVGVPMAVIDIVSGKRSIKFDPSSGSPWASLMLWSLLGIAVFEIILGCLFGKTKNRAFGIMLIILMIAVPTALVFFWAPLLIVAEDAKVSLGDALPLYWASFLKIAPWFLGGVVALAVLVASVMGLTVLFFRASKALRQSFIGRVFAGMWHAIKTGTCPTILWLGADPESAKPADPTTPQ